VIKRKNDIIEEFKKNELDTGSCEVQIAIFTNRINGLKNHFRINKKDNHSRLGLLRMISKRRKLLKYMKRKNLNKYKDLILKLNLRK
jgi:small subunit ribosomal protein S15